MAPKGVDSSMQNLYRKCLNLENIKKAIKEVNGHDGSRTPGPDGISFKFSKIPEEVAIKEVKLKLRRYKKVCSRIVSIPKKDGKTRELTIINLYDRYAQQAVYRVVNPIIESKMSKHSYGFRLGISAKVPVARVADSILHSKNIYTVEIDFTKCFDNIPLDKALNKLRELGVKDSRLIKTIKHLMFISREYSGVGLGQGTILGPMLANCYLDKLDRFMEREFQLERDNKTESRQRDYRKHKEEWLEWLKRRNRKVYCKYYRYADDTIILTTIKEEQQYIWDRLMEFIESEMEVSVNLAKSVKRRNKTDFLGFHIMKSDSIWIKVKDEKEVKANVRKIRVSDHEGVRKFKRYVMGILNYYDIANELGDILSYLDNYLYFQSRKRHSYIKSVRETDNRIFRDRKNKEIIDIWKMRKDSKDSYKTYITNRSWISERERLVDFQGNENEWYIYKWLLFTKQRGKDKITGKPLEASNCHIHHVIPRSNGGNNEPENLILISKETHEALHRGGELPKEFKKYRKHLSC